MLLKLVTHLVIRKEVREVMAMLMATRIVQGKYTYDRVPRLLKEQVLDCLETLGFTITDGELVAIEA